MLIAFASAVLRPKQGSDPAPENSPRLFSLRPRPFRVRIPPLIRIIKPRHNDGVLFWHARRDSNPRPTDS